jgi:quercetin dioxygenase-like cupin family protein
LITAIAASALVSAAALGDERTTPLLHTDLQGIDGMEANIALVQVDPGFETKRHIHPGHVFIFVMEGAIEIDVDGQERLRVSAGEAAHELPNQPMIGRNASSTEGARFIVFQVGPAGEPLEILQPQ